MGNHPSFEWVGTGWVVSDDVIVTVATDGAAMYESADIVAYLFERYGRRSLPLHWRFRDLQQLGSGVAGFRSKVPPSRIPSGRGNM